MDNPEEFRLFELARFDREVLRPRAALFAEPISNWAHQRYDLAELLEGYLWLELGVDLDIFPLREARSLCNQRYSHVSDASIEFLISWGNLFDPDVRDALHGFVTGKSFLGEGRLGTFDSVYHLRSDFNAAKAMHRRFVSHDSVRFFLLNVNFNPEFSLPRLSKSLDTYGSLDAHEQLVVTRAFEGFVEAVAYMDSFRQFLLDLRTRIPEKDGRLFSQRVQEVQKWRINCRGGPVKDFFELFAQRFSTQLPWRHDELQELLSPGRILPQIKGLMGDWGYPRAATLTV
jgi:hypothetical protein